MTTSQRLNGSVATWALLILATLVSFGTWRDPGGLAPVAAGSLAVLLAMAKAWLIGMRYMELATAPWPLRLAYDLWVAVVGVVLIAMFAAA